MFRLHVSIQRLSSRNTVGPHLNDLVRLHQIQEGVVPVASTCVWTWDK